MPWHRLLPLLLVLSVACFSAKDDDDDDDDDDDGADSGLVTDDTGASGDDTGDGGGGDEGGGDEGGGDAGGGDEGGGDEGGGDEGGGDGGGGQVGLCATTHAWALDFGSGTFVEPAGVGALVVEELDNTLLLGFTETSSIAVLVVGATDGVEQDRCVPTSELTGAWTDPRFSVGPDDITLRALEHDIRAYDAALSGTVTEDCESLEDVTFEALLDLRDMVDIFADLLGISDVQSACATISGFGVSCVSCPDGSPYCLEVEVENVDGAAISDPILPRTESAVLADGSCDGVGQGCESAPAPERRSPVLPLVLLSGLAVLGLRRR